MVSPNPDPNPNPNLDPDPDERIARLRAWFKKPFVLHALLAAGMILLIVLVSIYSRNFAERKAFAWLNMYNGQTSDQDGQTSDLEDKMRTTPTEGANANTGQTQGGAAGSEGATRPGDQQQAGAQADAPPPITDPERKRLNEQLKDVRAKITHHGTVMAFFYKAYYMSISVVMLAGLIAALALFFIAQNGWTGTNPYVKNVFLVMTAAAAYYGLFPSVFKQEENIADNKALFLSYKALENEVISYPLTRINLKGEKKMPQEFINYVDAQMTALGKIAIGFDNTKVTYKGVFDITERPNPGAGNNANGNTPRTGTRNQ